MHIYYWHQSVEHILKTDRLETSFNEKELNYFWRTVPSYFNTLNVQGVPSLWSQVKDLREFDYLKTCFSNNPYDIGLIETLIRESIENNIYCNDTFYGNEGQLAQWIRMHVLNFIGQIDHTLSQIDKDAALQFSHFFELLKSEIRSLDLSSFHDISPRLPSEISTLTWTKDKSLMRKLFFELKKPIKEHNCEIRFLGEDASYKDFFSLFNGNSEFQKLEWLEENPRNRQRTVINLMFLMKMLHLKGFVDGNHISIKNAIRCHFFNKPDKGISNLKLQMPKGGGGSERSKRICDIVQKLGE